MTTRAQIADRYTLTLRAPEQETIPDWAKEQIELDSSSPLGGKYEVENSPYLRDPLIAFQHDETRMVTTIGPNQGGRTKAMEVACLWAVKNRPGPMQWNTDTDDKAKDLAEKRWWPMAKNARTCSLCARTSTK
ncbi:MAG: phage terminase large subunit family protein [Acidobacteriota bacterium]|nr:phage terminase large subunit family protein [Acidobacteriota bacterium]